MIESKFYCARFYVTYRCNSRCSYCNVWRDEIFKNVKELSLNDAKKLIKQCYDIGIRYIDFTGGEPTLYPHLKEIAEYSKSLGIKTEVTSNCIASQSKQKLLDVAYSVDKFNTSLDTLDKEAYKRVRGVDACEGVKQAITEISKVRPPKIMTVVTDENIKELDTMIKYAVNNKSLIYLSPMFPYIDKDGNYQISSYIGNIIDHIFDAYTVVLLHFMKFFQESTPKGLPPCSANLYTITIAPNGNIVLPCYHAIEKQIPWQGNLQEALNTPLFQEYAKTSGQLKKCQGCCVIPYFGISFNYQLNKYFMLQSFSEKLYHLKRDALNELLPTLNPSKTKLKNELQELLDIIDAMSIKQNITHYRIPNAPLYQAQMRGDLAYTEIYKEPLNALLYKKESTKSDCWQLNLVPHYEFDKFCKRILIPLSRKKDRTEAENNLLRDAMEFEVHWWKYYIIKYFKLKHTYNLAKEELFIKDYLKSVNTSDIADLTKLSSIKAMYLCTA